MRTLRMCVGAVCALSTAGTDVAFGAVLPPELQGMTIDVFYGDGGHWSSGPGAFTMVEQRPMAEMLVWHLEGGGEFADNVGGVSFEMDLDTDPFVSSSFNVTNNLGVTQDFMVMVTIPAAPPFATGIMSGSISGSVLDSDGLNGATLATLSGQPLYAAQVDGSTARTLYDDPYSLSVSGGPGQETANIPTMTFSNEIGPGLVGTIGIVNKFSLTPGDTGQMVSFFRIDEYVPTPGSLALIGLAGLGVVRRRR